jgi:hypothetical protein
VIVLGESVQVGSWAKIKRSGITLSIMPSADIQLEFLIELEIEVEVELVPLG